MAVNTTNITIKSKNAEAVLLSHIQNKAWTKVQKIISFNQNLAKPCDSPCCPCCNQQHSPLLLACALNPPIEVVECLIKANPSAVFERDCEEKLPLHLACEYGAKPEVIKQIVLSNVDAAIKKDIYGMLPIHKVCESYFDSLDPFISDAEAEKFLMEVVQGLLSVQPAAVLIEDNREMNPIEYAVDSELSIAIIQVLQKISVQEHKKEADVFVDFIHMKINHCQGISV